MQVVADEGSAQVGLGVGGLWRFNYATVNAAVTGAVGVYDVFATVVDNVFTPQAGPPPGG